MPKKYTLEIPLYARPVEQLLKLNQSKHLAISVYGGVPDSPLNGGRNNGMIDGIFMWDRMLFALKRKQLERLTKKFYETVARFNAGGISFRLAYTNLFVEENELNETNLYPIQWLVESSRKHGVKNGIIINNTRLEAHVRRLYGDALVYISSCTKYVDPHRILSPKETKTLYMKDVAQYDYVVLTSQDSRRESVLKDMAEACSGRIMAIATSYCGFGCNSYDHYKFISQLNKTSLLKLSDWKAILMSVGFMVPHLPNCPILTPVNFEKIVIMQLNAGILHFKMGRGNGEYIFEKVVDRIEKHAISTSAIA
ncbi:MAG: hypothetical protein V2A70_07925 [Candidatus Omnitrophota bacterium]